MSPFPSEMLAAPPSVQSPKACAGCRHLSARHANRGDDGYEIFDGGPGAPPWCDYVPGSSGGRLGCLAVVVLCAVGALLWWALR